MVLTAAPRDTLFIHAHVDNFLASVQAFSNFFLRHRLLGNSPDKRHPLQIPLLDPAWPKGSTTWDLIDRPYPTSSTLLFEDRKKKNPPS